MALTRNDILREISKTMSKKEELEYLRNFPDFEQASLEELRQLSKQHIADYPGRIHHLGYLLQHLGSFNPWRASAESELTLAKFRRTKEEKVEFGKVAAPTLYGNLTEQQFHFVNPSTQGHVDVGQDTAFHFRLHFGTAKQQEYAKKLQNSEKSLEEFIDEQSLQYLDSLQKVFKSVRKNTKSTSRTAQQNYTSIQEAHALLAEISSLELQATAQSIAKVMNKLGIGQRRFLTETQDRVELFDFIEQELAQKNLHLLEKSYLRLRGDGEYSSEQKQLDFAYCYSYFARNRFVNGQQLFVDEREDIAYISSLPNHHPLIQQYGRLDTSSIDDLLFGTHDLRLSDIATVYDAVDFDQYRKSAFDWYFSAHQQAELDQTLDLFKDAFVDETGMLISKKVRKELKDHPFSAVLSQTDWRQSLNLFLYHTLYSSFHKVAEQNSIQFMQELGDESIASLRKVQHLSSTLHEHHAASLDALPPKLQEQVSLLKKPHLLPAERYAGDFALTVDKLKHLHGKVQGFGFWHKNGDFLSVLASANVFDQKINLSPFERKLRQFQPASTISSVALAQVILDHPQVRTSTVFGKYLDKKEIETSQAIVSDAPVFADTNKNDVQELWKKYDSLQRTQVFSGSLSNRLTLERKISFGGIERKTWGLVMNPELFSSESESYSEIDTPTVQKAQYLAQKSSTLIIAQQGLVPSAGPTWELTRTLGLGALLPRTLVEQINSVYDTLPLESAQRIIVYGPSLDLIRSAAKREIFSANKYANTLTVDAPIDKLDEILTHINSYIAETTKVQVLPIPRVS